MCFCTLRIVHIVPGAYFIQDLIFTRTYLLQLQAFSCCRSYFSLLSHQDASSIFCSPPAWNRSNYCSNLSPWCGKKPHKTRSLRGEPAFTSPADLMLSRCGPADCLPSELAQSPSSSGVEKMESRTIKPENFVVRLWGLGLLETQICIPPTSVIHFNTQDLVNNASACAKSINNDVITDQFPGHYQQVLQSTTSVTFSLALMLQEWGSHSKPTQKEKHGRAAMK